MCFFMYDDTQAYNFRYTEKEIENVDDLFR